MDLETPIGVLRLVASDDKLLRIELPTLPFSDVAIAASPLLAQAARELEEYFAGERAAFDVPFDRPGTPFERTVLARVSAIPFGQVSTYGAIARQIGRPTASRAVGMANGRNALPIVVPCHRVIGSHGALTGYAGGLDMKRFLLAHEQAISGSSKSHLAKAQNVLAIV